MRESSEGSGERAGEDSAIRDSSHPGNGGCQEALLRAVQSIEIAPFKESKRLQGLRRLKVRAVERRSRSEAFIQGETAFQYRNDVQIVLGFNSPLDHLELGS